jgi:rhodanese-related sulfurtransferase
MRFRDWLPFGSVPELSPEELAQGLRHAVPPQVIDVRTSIEFRQGHILGAHHAPVHELAKTLSQLQLDPSIAVIAVCKSAHRSIPAVRLLRDRGFSAYQLAGGMDRWQRLELPVVQGGPS